MRPATSEDGVTLLLNSVPKESLVAFTREMYSAMIERQVKQNMAKGLKEYRRDVEVIEGGRIADISVRRMAKILGYDAGLLLESGWQRRHAAGKANTMGGKGIG